jgi:hypothetical protein
VRLLSAHRLLVGAALVLQGLLIVWALRHRDQPGARVTGVLAAVLVPVLALYLRKLYRNPPLK